MYLNTFKCFEEAASRKYKYSPFNTKLDVKGRMVIREILDDDKQVCKKQPI